MVSFKVGPAMGIRPKVNKTLVLGLLLDLLEKTKHLSYGIAGCEMDESLKTLWPL